MLFNPAVWIDYFSNVVSTEIYEFKNGIMYYIIEIRQFLVTRLRYRFFEKVKLKLLICKNKI